MQNIMSCCTCTPDYINIYIYTFNQSMSWEKHVRKKFCMLKKECTR